jgi:hypothetical protein
MTSVPDGKQSPADGPIERDPPVSSSVASTSSLLVLARYYFNLTDGETMIRDEEGVWMRDLLGGRDDLEGLGQGAWIGRLRAPVGQLRLGGQAASHNLVG